MSKPKSKAGKSKKAKKTASRKPATPRRATAAAAQAQASSQQYPCNVLVNKGAEKIPVQVKDRAHHDRLHQEFGAANVEVQS